MSQLRGQARVKEICKDRNGRAKELHDQGMKVVGHYCCHVPREIFTAAGVLPVRILGDVDEPITEADNYLETIMCPFLRSTVDLGLKGRYDFLDGIVIPHTCDSVERMAAIWDHYIKKPFFHFLNVPHMAYDTSVEFFANEIRVFKEEIEKLTGKTITDGDLKAAIELHNVNRALLHQLYELRKADPPPMTGAETLEVVLTGLLIPVGEHNQLLREVIAEFGARTSSAKKQPRLLVYAAELDDRRFVDIIENCGATVVMDDMCIGTRSFWERVSAEGDLLKNLSTGYLQDVRCPRTHRHGWTPEMRFEYLVNYAKEFKVDGLVLLITRFCDTHEFDVPDVRDQLQANGVAVLSLDHDYSVTASGQFQTRIEAFLETLRLQPAK